MIYQPIQSSGDFRNRIFFGSSKESVHLDFKAQLNNEDPPKIAIDIAAFANTLGGTLLIGVSEKTENGVTTAGGFASGLELLNYETQLKVASIIKLAKTAHWSMVRKTGNCSNFCGGE